MPVASFSTSFSSGGSAKRGGGAQHDGGSAVAAVRMAVDYGGRRQFVSDVAVVWMMALGSGVCTINLEEL